MNSVLVEIYSTVLQSAPFVIAAYVLMWLALCSYLFILMRRMKKTEKQLDLIEEVLAAKQNQS